MFDFVLTGVLPNKMENFLERNTCRNNNCSTSSTDDSPEDILLFPGYSTALLQFAAMCCLMFMVIGILGNLITIVALLGCKKVKRLWLFFYMRKIIRKNEHLSSYLKRMYFFFFFRLKISHSSWYSKNVF